MFFSNIDSIPGKAIQESLGLVFGSTVRAKHLGKDVMASFRNVVGGELKNHTALFEQARHEALARMQEEAHRLGANAVISIRFETTPVANGATEIFVYGTAVRVA